MFFVNILIAPEKVSHIEHKDRERYIDKIRAVIKEGCKNLNLAIDIEKPVIAEKPRLSVADPSGFSVLVDSEPGDSPIHSIEIQKEIEKILERETKKFL